MPDRPILRTIQNQPPMPEAERQYPRARQMVVTDLDGTLLPANRVFSPPDVRTLSELRHQGILRIIATGRSLYSAESVIPPDFPIDYLIFSSGAGILHWQTRTLLCTHKLVTTDIQRTSRLLQAYNLDFMIHYPIPDNHRFVFHATQCPGPDFQRRYQRYQQFSAPLMNPSQPGLQTACQFVAIDPRPGESSCYAAIKQHLSNLKVIRSTSPLDGMSTWIEIFPASVSKGLASDWIARQHRILPDAALAIGNDYNDLDVLEWAGLGCVVRNAPLDLQQQYKTVNSHDEHGFTEAVTLWLEGSHQSTCVDRRDENL